MVARRSEANIDLHPRHLVKVTLSGPAYLGSWPPAPSPWALFETGTRWAWPWTWCRREHLGWSPPAPFRWSPRSGRGSREFSCRRAEQMCSSGHGWWLTAHSSLSKQTFWTCRWRTPVNPQTPQWAASARPTHCGWSLNPQAALKDTNVTVWERRWSRSPRPA